VNHGTRQQVAKALRAAATQISASTVKDLLEVLSTGRATLPNIAAKMAISVSRVRTLVQKAAAADLVSTRVESESQSHHSLVRTDSSLRKRVLYVAITPLGREELAPAAASSEDDRRDAAVLVAGLLSHPSAGFDNGDIIVWRGFAKHSGLPVERVQQLVQDSQALILRGLRDGDWFAGKGSNKRIKVLSYLSKYDEMHGVRR